MLQTDGKEAVDDLNRSLENEASLDSWDEYLL